MARCNKILVYSALHTGTHFVCITLEKMTTSEAEIIADRYTYDTFGKKIEDLDIPTKVVGKQWINKTLPMSSPEFIILSGHQMDNSNLYRSLVKIKPRIPVIVPMRDPLLSFNSLAWRQTGSISNLHKTTLAERKQRVVSHIRSIIRMLEIPENYVLFVPVDIQKTEKQKIDTLTNMIRYAGEKPSEDLVQYAKDWPLVNKTTDHVEKMFNETGHTRFIDIKNGLLRGNIEPAQEYFDEELDLITRMLEPYIPKLKSLGYRDLCWW